MKTIEQRIEFGGVTPEDLFEMYVDPRKHAKAIGAPVTISRDAGSTFAAFGEQMVRGRNLLVAARSRVVQTWRAQSWRDTDPDSIVVLTFTRTAGGAAIDLVQAGVPDASYDAMNEAWHQMYWTPWRQYLQSARVN
ncbi:MAG TPA: SRPBCC domain-containing protein [Thermoanaerobaculia bacterium]